MVMASSSTGKAKMMSMARMIPASHAPPAKPAAMPSEPPTITAKATESPATSREVR